MLYYYSYDSNSHILENNYTKINENEYGHRYIIWHTTVGKLQYFCPNLHVQAGPKTNFLPHLPF